MVKSFKSFNIFSKDINEDYESVDNIFKHLNSNATIGDAQRWMYNDPNIQPFRIGEGLWAEVYDDFRGSLVLKLARDRGGKQDSWVTWISNIYNQAYEDVRQGETEDLTHWYPKNPYYPRIYLYRRLKDGYIAALERLTFDPNRIPGILGMDQYIDNNNPNYPEMQVYNLMFRSFQRKFREKNERYAQIFETVAKYQGPNKEQYFRDACDMIDQTVENSGGQWDLHFMNIALRNDKDLVFTDPVS